MGYFDEIDRSIPDGTGGQGKAADFEVTHYRDDGEMSTDSCLLVVAAVAGSLAVLGVTAVHNFAFGVRDRLSGFARQVQEDGRDLEARQIYGK